MKCYYPAAFSLAPAMVQILPDCGSFTRAYYDDCIVASRNRKQDLQHLHINSMKSQVMKCNAIFLGHNVSNKELFPEASKVAEVVNFFTSSCASDVKSFLRMVSFFKKFVASFYVNDACLFDQQK